MANNFTAAEYSAFLLQIVKVGLFLVVSRRSETDFNAQYVNGAYGASNIETHLKHSLWEVASFTTLVRRHKNHVLLSLFSQWHRSLTTCIRLSWKCAPSIGHDNFLAYWIISRLNLFGVKNGGWSRFSSCVPGIPPFLTRRLFYIVCPLSQATIFSLRTKTFFRLISSSDIDSGTVFLASNISDASSLD